MGRRSAPAPDRPLRQAAGQPRPAAAEEGGFTLVELVVAISIAAVVFVALAHATGGSLVALQAGRERSAFIELANAELERLRSMDFDAVGVADDDPDLTAAYPGNQHDGRDAVLLDVDALQAADPDLPDPPAAVEDFTSASVGAIRTPYTVRRWITWSGAGGTAGLTEVKRIDLVFEWSESGRATRQVSLQSLLYPGNKGPAGTDNPPTALASVDDDTVTLGTAVNFTGSASADPEGAVTYGWQFGDGTTSTVANPSKTYTAAGTYGVVLTVTDTSGQTSSASLSITIQTPANLPPTAAFVLTLPHSSTAPLTVNVSGSGSSDPEGTVLMYVWNWGDGTANGSGVNATHVYTAAGTYTLTLTVTDGAGLTATSQTDVTATPLGCHITAAWFKNPSSNTVSNFIELKNGGQANNGQFSFSATSNTACTSMGVSLPISGGTYTTTLTFTDAGTVRNWSVTVTIGNPTKWVQANNQSGTFSGSGGASFPITFSAST